jgi:multicomponent Na+:H+ antiporter subunit D
VLLFAGVAMALYGVVYAVLENDIRRRLAYSTISQVGYMVAGAGMGTAMALDGATAHAFSHILYKSLLFMCAGAVIYATGKEKLTELGGLARAMPLALGLYAVGAAAISGVPLFNGFVSKAIVVSAAGQGGWPLAELLLTLASVGTLLHTGLALLWFTFITPKDRRHETIRPLPRNMYAAMIAGATLCAFFGVAPGVLYAWLPFGTEYHPYTVNHVVTSLQLLTMTAFAFWWLFGRLAGEARISIDTDWVYRKLLPGPVLALSRGIFAGQEAIGRGIGAVTDRVAWFSRNPLRLAERWFGRGVLGHEGASERDREYSADAYRFPVGVAVFVVLLVFGGVAVWHLLQLARGA